MNFSKRIITVFLSVSLLISALSVPNTIITDAKEASETPAVFFADFSYLKDGEISKSDKETVNALESKFSFYHEQSGYYFERPNVNGYLCLEDGTDTYGTVSNQPGTAYYMPDTGHSANYTNFDGANNDRNYPLWTVDGKWLYLNADPYNEPFNFIGMIYPASASSTTGLATLENFTLEMDFKFRGFDEKHVQKDNSNWESLSIFARQSYAGNIRDNKHAWFDIQLSGVARYGTGGGLNCDNVRMKDGKGNDTAFERGKEYHLTLTAVGTTVSYNIKTSDGTVAAVGSFAAPITGQGYLGIGGSNEGVAMANIEITRLDSDGNAIEFYDENNGYGVSLDVSKFMHYRGIAGNKDSNFREYIYLKNPEDSTWIYTAAGDVGMYTFNDEITDAEQVYANAIDKKFNVYYDYSNHNVYTKMDHLFENTSRYDSDVPNIKTKIQAGCRLFFQYDYRCHAEWPHANMISLVPKTADGNDALLTNFELEFTPGLYWSDDRADGVSLSFRSGFPGRNSGYSDKVTLVVGQAGFQLYDNVMPPNFPFESGNYIPWTGGNCADPTIKLKVVGNTLAIYATKGSTVIYDGTFKLKDGADTGYLYISAANNNCALNTFAVRRLDSKGNPDEWEDGDTDRSIVSISSGNKDITINRKNNEVLSLPKAVVGEDALGNKYDIPVEFSCNEYRSYLDKDFDFIGTVISDRIKLADGMEIKLKVRNRINGDFNTETSRKYYFDHSNDLLDFTCRLSTYDLADATEGYKVYPVTMNKVSASDYWKVIDGYAWGNYAKTVDGGWNGLSRISDITSMLLEDPEMMLINYKLEIDYRQPNGYYSYLICGVQDPSKTFADLYLNTENSNLSIGTNTDIKGILTGGIYTYMEREGAFNSYGGLEGGGARFDMDLPGYTFVKNYMNNLNNVRHMTITVLDGEFSVQVDDSAVYYANVTDEAYGGYIGFGGQGQGCIFDNFQITALDEFGEPMSLAEAEKGFAPEIPEDTYTGWNPSSEQLKFVWGKEYEH